MSSTERLYEYISARQYGEHHGNCNAAYPQCPFSIFSVMDPFEDSSMYPVFMSSNDVNVTEQVYGDKPWNRCKYIMSSFFLMYSWFTAYNHHTC